MSRRKLEILGLLISAIEGGFQCCIRATQAQNDFDDKGGLQALTANSVDDAFCVGSAFQYQSAKHAQYVLIASVNRRSTFLGMCIKCIS